MLAMNIAFLAPSGINAPEVLVTDVRSNEGSVYVFVYNYQNQYPDNPYRYFEFKKSESDFNGQAYSFNLDSLEAGMYAIAVFDDENANGEMDRFLGIPREGYGFSNGGKPRFFKLPRYEDLLVSITSDKSECVIEMRYAF